MKIGTHLMMSCEIRPCANFNGVVTQIDVPMTLEAGDTLESAIAEGAQILRSLAQVANHRLAIMNGRAPEIPPAALPLPATPTPVDADSDRLVAHRSVETDEDDGVAIEKVIAITLPLETPQFTNRAGEPLKIKTAAQLLAEEDDDPFADPEIERLISGRPAAAKVAGPAGQVSGGRVSA